MKFLVLLVALSAVNGFTLKDNEVFETPRLKSGDELVDSVISDCFEASSTMACLKMKVLSYLDTKLGVNAESARAFEEKNIDKVIFDRVGRIINGHNFRMQLPEFIFQNAEISYRADRGFDVDIPESNDAQSEGKQFF